MTTNNWTDVVQAIAAIIAIPGTFVSFILLIRKNKARESEIQSLSEIAGKLTRMQQDSEYRYKLSKKPIIVMRVERFEKNTIRLTFRNTNSATMVKHFSIKSEDPSISYTKSLINYHNGEQFFSADVNVGQMIFEKMTLGVEYVTEDNYEFFQYLFLDGNKNTGEYLSKASPLMGKDQFHHLANDGN